MFKQSSKQSLRKGGGLFCLALLGECLAPGLLDPVFLLSIAQLESQSPSEVRQTPSWSPWCSEDAAGILRPVVGVHLALELIFHSLHAREEDAETHYPGPALATLPSCSWGSLEPRQGGHRGGGSGVVCQNERGRSCLLETNFTNDFCNN